MPEPSAAMGKGLKVSTGHPEGCTRVLGSAWKDGLPRDLRGTWDPWSLRKVPAQVSACLCGIMSSGLLTGLEGNRGLLDVSRPVGLKRQGQVYCDTGSP